ncbi:hypothetical protein QQF64_029829 [Cirrhinus molitorella]|uniref:HECT domain-containing protein n=1 Tax=Cirrhinus molitorella TaxID=172907 RepID=A0ABR3N1M4_9TELE
MIAVCIVHGGVGPHFFSERLFQQICGLPTSPASVDEVGDHTFREQLIKIQETSTVPEANCAIAEAADSLSMIGALRYISNLTEKDSFVQSAVEFFTHGRLQAALDQQQQKARENKTICHWRDWLIDVEEGECDPINLQMIMEFTTGASSVPPLGFPHSPQIEFLHDNGKIFPEANTCLVVLRLPIHTEYEMFKRYMTDGIVQSPTFGVA